MSNSQSTRRYLRLARYIVRFWPRLLGIIGLTVLMSSVVALQPWPLKVLVDYALGSAPTPDGLRKFAEVFGAGNASTTLIMVAACASVGLFAVNIALQSALTWLWALTGQRMIYALAADLFGQFQRLSVLFHGRQSVGDSLSRLTGDTSAVYAVTNSLLVDPAQHLLTMGLIGVVAWQMDPGLTVLALIAVPILTVSAVFFGRLLKIRERQTREAQSRVMSFVQQTVSAMPMVQAFNAVDRNREHFDALAADAIRASQRKFLLGYGFTTVNALATTSGLAIVLYAGGLRVMDGELTLGSLLVFVAYMRSMQSACTGLMKNYAKLRTAGARIDRVFEVLDAEERIDDRGSAGSSLPSGPLHIHLQGVSFGYEPDRSVLEDVELDVRPGECVALIGPTGAGKTTLISLILRFFDPRSGVVRFNGTDIREFAVRDVRGSVSLVLQETFLLPLTVAENIAYGRPGANREDVVAAAVAANAHDFIQRLPQKYDTVLGERDMTLSGGEGQRIAIARALLKDAPILILDEPTSALDAVTEGKVMEATRRLMRGRTTIIIAHRLSTIRNADRVVVIDRGRVVESGSHEQLIAARGMYQRLYSLQFVAPTEEGAA